MMHTVVISRRNLEAHPTVASAVYDAFLESKTVAAEHYRQSLSLYEVHTMVPWMNSLVESNRTEFPSDWWPYGLEANRDTVDTYLRYHYEQGLSQRRWRVEEIFHAV
jgi:4,5-dihydroxyphthalate decarboxylase